MQAVVVPILKIRVQEAPFDPGAEMNAFTTEISAVGAGAGALVTFTGLTRDNGGTLGSMEIEHYAGMTENALDSIISEAAGRWPLAAALIIHRHGLLYAKEPIMMVATAAPHRADAFAAAEFLMDYLKSRAPFWKKEIGHQGEEAWVSARTEDEASLGRW